MTPAVPVVLLFLTFAALIQPTADAQSATKDSETICSASHVTPEAAVEACSKLIASGRFTGAEHAKIMFWRGYAHDRQNAIDPALADYSEAIRLDPTSAAAYEGRARLLLATGQRERAIADWGELVKIDPKNLTAYVNRGALLYLGGDLDWAIADFDAALAIDPNNATAFGNRGSVWREKGDLDRAIADLDRAIALQPDYGRAFHNRAVAWERKGDAARALADYDAALRLDPEMIAALVQRAGLRGAKGDREGAKSDLMTATSAPAKYFDDKQAQDLARERLARMEAADKSR